MRELSWSLWSGSSTYKDMEEVLEPKLKKYRITDDEWIEFRWRRFPVECSLLQVGAGGIGLSDLAQYHCLAEADLLELLNTIGAVRGEDERFRLAAPLPGGDPRPDVSWRVLDNRSPVRRMLEKAGAAGLLLDDLVATLDLPADDVVEKLATEKALKGNDGRYRLRRPIDR